MSGAEALSVVGSIIAIVQISKTILSLCHFYIDGVEGAPSDLRVILIEVSALKGIAKSLQYLTQPNVATSTLMSQLAGISGPIEGCKKALKELEALLPPMAAPVHGQTSKRRKLSLLAWPFKSEKAKKLLQEIMQHKTTINLALTAEYIHDLKDVKAKTERIQNLLTETERNNIYRWLETTNPSDIHNRSQRLYEHGTGSWVHKTPEWSSWMDGSLRCLWLHGIPGAGKSILASHLIERIEKHCRSVSTEVSKIGHVYYYCYFGHNQDESSHFLRWIMSQLCRQSGNVSQEIQDIYESGKSPSLPSLLLVLHHMMSNFERVYVVLDAVDESMPREDLLSIIQDLSTDLRFERLSLLVTSRRYLDIEETWKSCSTPISMSNSFVEEDIRVFVRSKVQSDAKYKKWPKSLIDEMVDIVPKRAEGMFRWAVCQLDILKRLKPEASTIKAALSNLPKTLDETYDRIFLAIPENDWLSVQHVFYWLFYHNELYDDSMTLSTLLQAVQTSTEDLLSPDADQLYDFEGLRERCGCLIMVEEKELKNQYGYVIDTTATVVNFAHYTVKEYLQSRRLSQKSVCFFALIKERIRKSFSKLVLRQALAITPGSLAGYKDEDDEETIYELLTSNFKLYCGISSALQFSIWPDILSSDAELIQFSEALVNPLKPSHSDLDNLFRMADNILDQSEKTLNGPDAQFWKIVWLKPPDQNAAIFLSFLLTAYSQDGCHLALEFTRTHSMLAVLTQQLHIRKEVWEMYDELSMPLYDFEGTIPEMTAQWAGRHPAGFKFVLGLISDLGATHFDISSLLLAYIGSNQHRGCAESGILETLLRLGADPNGPKGGHITPLQIAAAWWDFNGVETLLNAGADPNYIAGIGLAWTEDSLMQPYNRLHGASPLCIIENSVCVFDASLANEFEIDELSREKTQRRLLDAGGVVIEPKFWDVFLGSIIEADTSEEHSSDNESFGSSESEN